MYTLLIPKLSGPEFSDYRESTVIIKNAAAHSKLNRYFNLKKGATQK